VVRIIPKRPAICSPRVPEPGALEPRTSPLFLTVRPIIIVMTRRLARAPGRTGTATEPQVT
jgi:hypothetical protein